MVELVERMLDLHKRMPKAKTPHEQESLKRTTLTASLQEVCADRVRRRDEKTRD